MVVVSTGSHGKPFLLGDTLYVQFGCVFIFIYLFENCFLGRITKNNFVKFSSNQNRVWNEKEKTKKLFGCRNSFLKITNFIFLLFSQESNKDLIDIDSSLKPAKLPTKDFPTKTTTLITNPSQKPQINTNPPYKSWKIYYFPRNPQPIKPKFITYPPINSAN